MDYKEFKNLKRNDICVIIKTGEPGAVTDINHNEGTVQLKARRYSLGVRTEWHDYTHLAFIGNDKEIRKLL